MLKTLEGAEVRVRGIVKLTGNGGSRLIHTRAVSVEDQPEVTKLPVKFKHDRVAVYADGCLISCTDFIKYPEAVELWAFTGTGYVDHNGDFIIDSFVSKKRIKRTYKPSKKYFTKNKCAYADFHDMDISSMYPIPLRPIDWSKIDCDMEGGVPKLFSPGGGLTHVISDPHFGGSAGFMNGGFKRDEWIGIAALTGGSLSQLGASYE